MAVCGLCRYVSSLPLERYINNRRCGVYGCRGCLYREEWREKVIAKSIRGDYTISIEEDRRRKQRRKDRRRRRRERRIKGMKE